MCTQAVLYTKWITNNRSASTNLCCFHIRFLLFACSCVLVLGPFQISAVWVPIPGIGSFLVWMQWKKWFFWGGLLFFLEIPRNAYLLIHIERNGSYTNLRFAKIEKKIKKSMLVLYRTEVEDLFEYWVHRNKVFFGGVWFLITISIHTVLSWLTLLDQQARSTPPLLYL